uniref:Putative secreted protein n=1 Tax=Anopheles darlingi TaxID=43151 RepID=A0A2M4D8L0_ANODA
MNYLWLLNVVSVPALVAAGWFGFLLIQLFLLYSTTRRSKRVLLLLAKYRSAARCVGPRHSRSAGFCWRP